MAFVVLTSFTNTNVSVQAATHTHVFNIFVGAERIGDGYIASGHYWKTTSTWKCSCGALSITTERKLESHTKTSTNYHHGTQHTFGDSCGICGWSNVTTYSCPGGNGGLCIYPY